MLRIVDLPPEVLELLRYGRGVDNERVQATPGSEYRYTTPATVDAFAQALRLERAVGDSRPAYKYERDVETFFRHSPAVVRPEGRCRSTSSVEDHVERRLRRAAASACNRLLEHLAQSRLAGLCAEPEADLLRQRVRRADGRRRGVEQRRHRVLRDVRRAVVERDRLDEQHRAAGSRCSRAYRALPTGSPMSWRQSKKQMRSYVPS